MKLSKGKDRKQFESSKRKATCHVQGNTHKTLSAGALQARREWDDIQYAERKSC